MIIDIYDMSNQLTTIYAKLYIDGPDIDEKIIKIVANGYKVHYQGRTYGSFMENNKICVRDMFFDIQIDK